MSEQRRGRPALALDPVRLRLSTGLVLFLFAATHLANHALGLVSLAAMEAGLTVFVGFWRTPPAEIVLLLKRVDLSRLHNLLGQELVGAELERVVAELREIGTAQPAPPAVAAYVAETFAVTDQ